jgi:NifU-like protein
MWDYTPKVMDHFLNPRNVGEIEDADAIGEVGNITCGDAMKLFLKIDSDSEEITDAKFQTFGCASAIASASALSELVKGKTLTDAMQLSNQDIAEFLGELPEEKMHCSVMGKEALEAAAANYRGETYEGDDHAHDDTEIVCTCFGVTRGKIETVVRENNLSTLEQVTHFTKAGGGCEGCHDHIREILDEIRKAMAREAVLSTKDHGEPAEKRPLTNIQRMQKITQAIEREVRPALQKDGGDIDLVDIDGHKVYVALRGACHGCSAANFTLKTLVETKINDFIGEEVEVLEVESC